MDPNDILRDKLLDSVFGKKEEKTISESKEANFIEIQYQLQDKIFAILEENGITRQKATAAVANFMQNLNRIK